MRNFHTWPTWKKLMFSVACGIAGGFVLSTAMVMVSAWVVFLVKRLVVF